MVRKYEVHVAGKPVIIGERPRVKDLRVNWLVIRIDDLVQLRSALRVLKRSGEVQGLWLYGRSVSRAWSLFRSAFRFVQAAGGAVTDEHGRLLVIRRKGKLDLPKGKMDKGEGVEEGALREVCEECGLIRVRIVRPLAVTWHTYTRRGRQELKRTDWFLMRSTSRQKLVPEAKEMIEEVFWMKRDAVRSMRQETYASLRKVLNAWAVAVRPRT
jgi:ADP-ribose pyrophosphatase YjhB (NUDIX family)